MILTCKRSLVDIYLTCSLSKSLAFCEFSSVKFEPWFQHERPCLNAWPLLVHTCTSQVQKLVPSVCNSKGPLFDLSGLECFAECLMSICSFVHFFFPGDLTEDQKKIFKANQFYRGLTIPEPQEMVSQIHVRLLLMLFQKKPLEF